MLERVECQTLSERLRRGRLPLDETLRVERQIAEAVEAAHAKGIIHRDLKPGNIKLTPEGRVKVLNFGPSKMTAGSAGIPAQCHQDFANWASGGGCRAATAAPAQSGRTAG